MKKTLIATVIFLGMGALASPSYADLTFNLGTVFPTKPSPAGTEPWATINFQDSAANEVLVTITNLLESDLEFISEFDFNSTIAVSLKDLDAGVGVDYFNILNGSLTDPSFAYSPDTYQADGDGKFDIMLSFVTNDGPDTRFTKDDVVSFILTGTGLTSANFNSLSVPQGGEGIYHVAAHVQGLGVDGEDSTWIGDPGTPIPEPATMLLFGTGLIGLAGIGRKKRS